jgi:hypothetical protein
MNQRADSGKKNLPGVALPPRNNKACWLLSHTAARDKDANCNEAPPLRAIVRFLSSGAGKTGMQPCRANRGATLFDRAWR